MTPPRLIFASLILTLVAFQVASAQETGRGKSVSRAEKVARAQWQPVRRAQATEELPAPSGKPTPGDARAAAPQPMPFEGEEIYDGQIIVEDGYEYGPEYAELGVGSSACDAMACDGTSCGSCDSMGGCGCRGNGWQPCLTLCFPQDGWFAADYLLWSQKGMYLPPLVTRGSARNVNPANGDIVYGDGNDYLEGSLNGLRLNFGIWLDRCHEWSVAAEYFGWDQISEGASFRSNGVNSFGRPFFDATAGGQRRANLIDFNGTINGSPITVSGVFDINATSELHSGGFQFRRFLAASSGCGDTVFLRLPANYRSRTDLGIGYRYTQLDESLSMITNTQTTVPTTAAGTLLTSDLFTTTTQFNGFDFGIFYTRQRGLWNLDLRGKFAIGTNRQTVLIDGSTTRNVGTPQTRDGGFLALSTNMGERSRDRLSVLPEFGADLGYQLTPRLRAKVGYTFMYWSNVVRPGDHIDLDIDARLVPFGPGSTSTRPEFKFNETDYWAQGVSFGGEFRW